VDLSKKGTSGKMLPNDSNLTAEEVRKSPKSTVYEMIEAGDIASSNPLRIDPEAKHKPLDDSHLCPNRRAVKALD
jgi:hypothetical protein